MFKKIYIEIINYCNLNCKFCVKTTKDKKMLSLSEFEHILDEIKPYTKYIYLHIQGEPLMHPDINKFIILAYNKGFSVNLTTNATLLHNHLDIMKYVRQVNISLQAIVNLKDNEKYYNDIFALIEKDFDTYISLRLWGNFSKNEALIPFEKHYQRTIDLNSSNKLKEHVFFSSEEEFDWPNLNSKTYDINGTCLGTKTHIGILSDGTVVPCCLDKDGAINLGNILTTPFKDIITSQRFLNIKNGFTKNILCEELCKKCTYRQRFKK